MVDGLDTSSHEEHEQTIEEHILSAPEIAKPKSKKKAGPKMITSEQMAQYIQYKAAKEATTATEATEPSTDTSKPAKKSSRTKKPGPRVTSLEPVEEEADAATPARLQAESSKKVKKSTKTKKSGSKKTADDTVAAKALGAVSSTPIPATSASEEDRPPKYNLPFFLRSIGIFERNPDRLDEFVDETGGKPIDWDINHMSDRHYWAELDLKFSYPFKSSKSEALELHRQEFAYWKSQAEAEAPGCPSLDEIEKSEAFELRTIEETYEPSKASLSEEIWRAVFCKTEEEMDREGLKLGPGELYHDMRCLPNVGDEELIPLLESAFLGPWDKVNEVIQSMSRLIPDEVSQQEQRDWESVYKSLKKGRDDHGYVEDINLENIDITIGIRTALNRAFLWAMAVDYRWNVDGVEAFFKSLNHPRLVLSCTDTRLDLYDIMIEINDDMTYKVAREKRDAAAKEAEAAVAAAAQNESAVEEVTAEIESTDISVEEEKKEKKGKKVKKVKKAATTN